VAVCKAILKIAFEVINFVILTGGFIFGSPFRMSEVGRLAPIEVVMQFCSVGTEA